MKTFLSICLFSILSTPLLAQVKNLPKITVEDLSYTTSAIDSNANAEVLLDIGILDFKKGLYIERSKRVKIFNDQGFKHASFSIPVDNLGRSTKIKAYTYTLENGKIVKTPLEKENIYNEKNDLQNMMVFTMPNLKEGCIVEVNYKLSSGLYALKGWYFQSEIPTVKSEFTAIIQENFIYNIQLLGSGKVNKLPEKWDYENGRIHKWQAFNVPALEEVPFVATMDNYLTRVEFELASVETSYSNIDYYANSWKNVVHLYKMHANIGEKVEKNRFLREIVSTVKTPFESDRDKANAIYKHIRDRVNPNQEFWVSSNTLKEIYNGEESKRGDINILLVAALKAGGFTSHPVLISTRENGILRPQDPTLNGLNYVLCAVVIDSSWVYLDANLRERPFGMLPFFALNKYGINIGDDFFWARIEPLFVFKEQSQILVTPNLDEMRLDMHVKEMYADYGGYMKRMEFAELETLEDYTKEFNEENPTKRMSNLKVENRASGDEKLIVNYDLENDMYIDKVGNKLLIEPVGANGLEENPFHDKNRTIPIDFGYLKKEQTIITINIPTGYTVESLPKNARYHMPENNGKFRYNIQSTGSTIHIAYDLSMNKDIYSVNEYMEIQKFTELIVTKLREPVILIHNNEQ